MFESGKGKQGSGNVRRGRSTIKELPLIAEGRRDGRLIKMLVQMGNDIRCDIISSSVGVFFLRQHEHESV